MSTASWRRASARLSVSTLFVVGAVVSPAPAGAVAVDPAVQAGVALPGNWSPYPAYLQFATASADYVAYAYTDDEYGAPVTVHRVSDGAVVGTLPDGVTLAGDSYVTRTYAANGLVSHVAVAAVASGASGFNVAIPTGQNVLAVGETWVVTAPAAGGSVHLLTQSGDRVLAGVATDSAGECVDVIGDATGVLLHCGTSVWLASVATGAVTTVTTAAGYYSQILLTPGRAFWVEEGFLTGDTLHWHDRAGSGTGTVATLLNNNGGGFLGYGNTVLERVAPAYNASLEYDLDPVDLATGAAGAPVVTHVTYAESPPGGVTLVVAADSQAGRVAVVASGSPVRTLADLTLHAFPATDVYASGPRVAMAYTPGNASTTAVAPADGSSGWSDNLDGLPQGTAAIAGTPIAFAGDVALTQPSDAGCRLTWPEGHRDLDTQCTGGNVALGRGGLLVQTYDETSQTYSFERVTQAGTLLRTPWTSFLAMDGTTVWTLDPLTGGLTGTDLSGATPTRTVPTGITCGNLGSLRVAGRWALLECPSGYSVVDLLGVVPSWRLPRQTGDGVPLLGGDFVAWTHTQHSSDQPSFPYLTLVATELASGHRSQVYGPVHDLYAVGSRVAAVDDAGGRWLVYLDTAFRMRRVDLGWLAAAPTTRPDTSSPTLVSITGSVRRSAGGPVTVSWAFTDPSTTVEPASGLVSYDVRYRQIVGGVPTLWQQPAQWQGTGEQSVTLPTTPGQTSCVDVRGRDAAGNVSNWSADWCSLPPVDSSAPRVTVSNYTLQLVRAAGPFSYTATDDVAVTSYDVSVRSARSGSALGSWRAPATWQRTSVRSVTLPMAPGSEACFRVRARDAAGNVSAWSTAHCELRPLDDRQLHATGAVRRTSDQHAVSGTVSQLMGRRATLTSPTQSGRAVMLLAVRGPGQGVVEVRVGGRLLATVHLDAKTASRAAITLRSRKPFVGAVSVRSISARPSRIDAVAVLR